RVRVEQERWGEARASFERVIADGMERSDVWTALGEVFVRLEENGLAEDAFQRAEAANPDDPNVFQARAEWLSRLGRAEAGARASRDGLPGQRARGGGRVCDAPAGEGPPRDGPPRGGRKRRAKRRLGTPQTTPADAPTPDGAGTDGDNSREAA